MDRSEEFAVKLARVERFLAENGLKGAILGRSDNFAWLGCGGSNVVDSSQETGVAALAVRKGRVTLIANNIEAERLLTEELDGLDVAATEVFPWHEPARRAAIIKRLAARGRFAADDGSAGLPALPDGFPRLRYALTETEIERYRVLGRDAAAAVESAGRDVEQGITEADVAALTAAECLERSIAPIVLLVAADERIRSWRHPIVKTTPVERCVMIVICGRRQGLVAAATRMLHFGPLPDDLRERHRAVCAVDATMMWATVPGRPVSEVFVEAQQAYAAIGFADEWQLHHQGGAIGYQPREYIATPDCPEVVQPGQAFAWNPSIRGTKSEDTMLATGDGPVPLTAPGTDWPVVRIEKEDATLERADILVK